MSSWLAQTTKRQTSRTRPLFYLCIAFFFAIRLSFHYASFLICFLIATTGLKMSSFFFLSSEESYLCEAKAAFFTSFGLLYPAILYVAWQFILPSRNKEEYIVALKASSLAGGLFFLGAAFSYFIIIPAASLRMLPPEKDFSAFSLDLPVILNFVISSVLLFGCLCSLSLFTIYCFRSYKKRQKQQPSSFLGDL